MLQVCEIQVPFGALTVDAPNEGRQPSPNGATKRGRAEIHLGDALSLYDTWPDPTVIISDGPYGLKSYPGDPSSVEPLTELYAPHVAAWSSKALPSTTLWFWNSELGWATAHPLLVANGWEFRNCHVWDKGNGHVAGNANTRTLRKFPVVTEVCVQYVRKVVLPLGGSGEVRPLKEWLRYEWLRTGLALTLTNQACGVIDAATRKYFTQDEMWYFPPAEAFEKLSEYANENGRPEGRPYLSIDGKHRGTGEQWSKLRSKFYCEYGVHNVWRVPPVRGKERLKNGLAPLHANQKPLELMELIVRSSSDVGDTIWEPFGGMCTGTLAALRLGRNATAAEINAKYYEIATRRLMEAEFGRISSA